MKSSRSLSSKIVTLEEIKQLGRDAQVLRANLKIDLGDELIDRRMNEIIDRLARYVEVAGSRKMKALTREEIEAAGLQETE